MRFARFHIAVGAVLAHAFALGQQLTNTSLDALAYENGSIRNNVDTNECFGFSLAIPAGWQLKPVGADRKAANVAKNVLILMVLDRHHEGAFKSQIALTAREAGGSVITAQETRAIWPLSIQNSGASTSGRALVLYRQEN